MRVLVTGGAGFIGSHVVDQLIASKQEVLVVDDLSTGHRENISAAARFAQIDLRDRDAVERVFTEFRPEVVSHQAAQVSVAVSAREPTLDASINVIGSLNVICAAARHGARRLVFASTGGAIYGEVPEGTFARVDTVPLPLSPYACSKLAVENYLRWAHRELGLASTILRYANVYGPRQDPHGEAGVVAIFAQRLLAGEPVQINARRVEGDDGCVRDYVHVDDVVRTNLRALRGELAEPIVNVGTGIPTSTAWLLGQIEHAMGIRATVRPGARRVGDVERSVLEPSRAAMGTITALEEGLPSTVAWFRAQRRPA